MNELVERPLTPTEIRQRQVDHLRLLTEIDNGRDEIAEHQRCVKESRAEIERLEQRERQLRRELRSGTVFEARQKKLDLDVTVRPIEPIWPEDLRAQAEQMGIDGSTDEPAPEIDPPDTAHDAWEAFAKQWPQARDHEQLRTDLSVALQGANMPTLEQLREWQPDTGLFQGAAHWARLEIAHMNASEYPDLWIPPRQPMPERLAELVKGKAQKKTRKARGKAEA
jgi:hypothetical protein